MKNIENVKRDWITKIEKNNLSIIDYISNGEIKCSCNVCGYVKIDNCRNLGYKQYKCKYCSLKNESNLIKEGVVKLLEIDGTSIKLICNNGHEYLQDRRNLLQNKGCQKCYTDNKCISKDMFLFKANKLHGNMFSYDLTNYKTLHSKIEIKCEKNHNFRQKASNHLQGKACPICRESLGERTISNYLKDNNIVFKRQKKFEGCKYKQSLRFDFYLINLNSVIEFDGIQHFEPVEIFGGSEKFEETKLKDSLKNEYCNIKGINILRINYKENILDKLNNFFVNI